jgi:hypothetical protein
MTTNKPRRIVDALGEIFEEMQATGCSYEIATERRQQRQQEEAEDFSNVIWLHSVNGSTAVH